jgi:hypothetical protein
MLTLTDFGDMLRPLSVGQRATLPYATYELLFPPGEPDDGARIRAFEFARSYGCEIDNQPSAGLVSFVKRITNPTPRAVILIIADRVDPISGELTETQHWYATRAVCQVGPATGGISDAGLVALTDPNVVLPVSGRPQDYRRVRVHDAVGSESALLEWREALGVTHIRIHSMIKSG